jgi:type I restriction enzyme S subunit
MSFPQYPGYRDSGVEWWGDVPTSWGILPAKRSFVRKKELNLGMKCENRLSLTLGGVVPRALDDLEGLQAAEFETYQMFSPDDLVFKLIDLQNIKTSRVGLVPEFGIMSPAYIRIVPSRSRVFPKFAYWFFTNLYNRCIFNELGGGVRQTISSEELLLLPFPALPVPEQTQIAAFLDRETAKIDALVAEQEKLIALLKEKRQAVISHAVTKGLDPSVPMQDSGVEWLGEVPAHWRMTRLAWICSEINDINHVMPVSVESGVPFLSAKDLLDDGTLNFIEDVKMISEEDFSNLSKKICPRRGDIIYSRIGACLGKARLVETDIRFLVSYSCCVVRVLPEHASQRFVRHLLDGEMILTEARMRTQGIGVPDLGLGEIGKFPVPLPPLLEQDRIADFLDGHASKFDALTSEAERTIKLLQERRTALISAAVTGKIDVRGQKVQGPA